MTFVYYIPNFPWGANYPYVRYAVRQSYKEVRQRYAQWLQSIPKPRKVERVCLHKTTLNKFSRAYRRASRGVSLMQSIRQLCRLLKNA